MCMCSVLKTLLLTSAFTPQIDLNVNNAFMPQINWNANNSAVSCAFIGNDLTNSLTKSEDCGDLCASTPGCTHYTWTDFNSGTCFMKQNKVCKCTAIPKHDQNAVCGIVDGLGMCSKMISTEVSSVFFCIFFND